MRWITDRAAVMDAAEADLSAVLDAQLGEPRAAPDNHASALRLAVEEAFEVGDLDLAARLAKYGAEHVEARGGPEDPFRRFFAGALWKCEARR